jgi:hypothetical protein
MQAQLEARREHRRGSTVTADGIAEDAAEIIEQQERREAEGRYRQSIFLYYSLMLHQKKRNSRI